MNKKINESIKTTPYISHKSISPIKLIKYSQKINE